MNGHLPPPIKLETCTTNDQWDFDSAKPQSLSQKGAFKTDDWALEVTMNDNKIVEMEQHQVAHQFKSPDNTFDPPLRPKPSKWPLRRPSRYSTWRRNGCQSCHGGDELQPEQSPVIHGMGGGKLSVSLNIFSAENTNLILQVGRLGMESIGLTLA